MPENEFCKIFSKNLRKYLELRGKKQSDLVKYLGISKSAVSGWYNGVKIPRMDTIDEICKYLNIKRSNLIEDKEETHEEKGEKYYYNEDTMKIANDIHNNKELRILFDASRDAKPEDLLFIVEMVKRMREK